MKRVAGIVLMVTILAVVSGAAVAYPLDGYDHTGIGRLEALRRLQDNPGSRYREPPGALLKTDQVQLRLLNHPDLDPPPPDPVFTKQVVDLLGANADRYSFAILDLSDPAAPRYAEHRADALYNPGSVGKLMVAMAWFQALADLYPRDTAARWRLLKNTQITANDVIISDHHPVKIWDRQTGQLISRPLRVGDTASLLEYFDWMLSASANAAASELIEQGMLLKHFGTEYPVSNQVAAQFFHDTPRAARGQLLAEFIQKPVTRNGFDLSALRQGSFFTRNGARYAPGTTSHASARQLLLYLLRLEEGRIVDRFSSLEIKRLLYMTDRRIRYASSPALRDAAVYFKSGSLYQCKPEPGFKCRKYHGNVRNLMNSVAIVEYPAGRPRLYYMVAIMSNVLRKNSAVDHQTLGTRIQRLIQSYHQGAGHE